MPWKLFVLAVVLGAGLYYFGYGPEELRRAAWDLSRANAEGVSPGSSPDAGWGRAA